MFVVNVDGPAAEPRLENAGDPSVMAAVLASRDSVASSRGGSRLPMGADRLEEVEAEAEATVQKLRRQEARREAARRAAELRRIQLLEARKWGAPIDSYGITSTFGEVSSLWSSMHTGIDLNAVTGTPVTAVGPGTVTFAGYDGSYGNKIVVRHQDGTESWYAHLSVIQVSVGSEVTNETVIGLVGATGNVTGDHLHLEIRPAGGEPVDPVPALATHGVHL